MPTGFLVALWLDPETAASLAVDGGESPNDLHITLCSCGERDELGDLAVARAIAAVEREVAWRPTLTGKIGGYGRFLASESSDGHDVFYAAPDVPWLTELRQSIVGALNEAGCPPKSEHGYTPHITLAYLDPGAANPVTSVDPLPLSFGAVTIMDAGRRIDIPLYAEAAMFAVRHDEAQPGRLSVVQPAAFAEPPEWAPFLPVPGQYTHPIYGHLDFSPERYDRIVEHFKTGVYQARLPVNAEHDVMASGAVGWITDMRIGDDGAIDAKVEWNERGAALIRDDRYKYVSAEWYDVWTDPVTGDQIPDVAVGLAITTHPYFKESVLRPLAASEAVLTRVVAGESGNAGVPGAEVPMSDRDPTIQTPPATPATELPTMPPAPPVTPPATPPAISLGEVVLTAEQRAQERRQFADLTARVELAERRASEAERRLGEVERERRRERFTAEVLGRSAENNIAWFGSIEENVNHLVSLAEKHGDDSPEVQWAVKQKRNEARAIQATGIFDPISAGGAAEPAGDVIAQVARLTEQKRHANPALTAAQAETAVFDEHPELYVRYLSAKR